MRRMPLKKSSKIELSIPLVILVVLILVVVLVLILLSLFTPVIRLNGEEELTIVLNSAYQEKGATAKSVVQNLNHVIVMDGVVDTTKPGNYEITYTAKKYNLVTKKVRKIHVVDDMKPQILLEGLDSIGLCPNDLYVEPGYSAFDNYDGDLTGSVLVSKDQEGMVYQVRDRAGNETIVKRKVTQVDKELPYITLYGNMDMTIIVGSKYFEGGYTATDNCDRDITKKITVETGLNVNLPGVYPIIYKVQDQSGNVATATRIVRVVNTPKPKNSTIYLTFDDGPSGITSRVLNILKEEGVPATFFVLDRSPVYNNLLNQIVTDGHTIALHSATHKFKTIYSSVDAYFNDLNQINNKVKSVTGVETKIIRFAGGSSNTVSRYNPGIMSTLVTEVANRGYRYYDWNIDSGDSTSISSSKLYYNVVNNLGTKSIYIVLMHDMEGNAKMVNVLRDIIRYGKNHGYYFGKINESTPQIKHHVNN